MLSLLSTNPLVFLFWIVGLTAAITIHEFAHAAAADRLGDPTPRSQGRLTLNPLAHLDPLGTLVLLIARFGWGKPVVFDPYNLENPKRDSMIIALAGPAANLALAAALSLILRLAPIAGMVPELLATLLIPTIFLNIMLAVFNLVPIHPLDGGKILVGLLPHHEARTVDLFLHRYGTFILILLIIPISGASAISGIISPIVQFILNLLLP